MKRPVIITRAMPGAEETAKRVQAKGFDAIVSPAIELVSLSIKEPMSIRRADELVFTSANGVRFFCEKFSERNQFAWCVGPATLAAAKFAGFDKHVSADGNSNDLAELILKSQFSEDTRYLHVANDKAAGTLVSLLTGAGRRAVFIPLYTVRPLSLSIEAHGAIESGDAIVLIHSQKGAEALKQQLGANDAFAVIAISEKAARPLSDANTSPIFIANRPNEDALMEIIEIAALQL